jgi:hypothetical protein
MRWRTAAISEDGKRNFWGEFSILILGAGTKQL